MSKIVGIDLGTTNSLVACWVPSGGSGDARESLLARARVPLMLASGEASTQTFLLLLGVNRER